MDFNEIMKKQYGFQTAYNPETKAIQEKAKKLTHEYNNLAPDDDARKKEILKELFGTSNDSIIVEAPFHCDYGFNIHVNGFVLINYNVTILDTSRVEIGNMVLIGPGTVIACAGHGLHPDERHIDTSKKIVINDNVWIGANATIIAGVTIGKGSIIGAGSVVTKDIEEGVIAAGNPCRVIRKITEQDRINLAEGEIRILNK